MSFDITPSTVSAGLTIQNDELSALRENISGLIGAINEYSSDTVLLGEAFRSHKRYKDEAHGDFLRTFDSACQAQEVANSRHISALETFLSSHDWYNEDHIQANIDDWTWELNWLNTWASTIGVFSSGLSESFFRDQGKTCKVACRRA